MLHTHIRLEMVMLMWITMMILKKVDSAQINDIQPNSMISADVGGNVTLHCFKQREDSSESVVWYKQKVGYEPCVLVSIQSDPFFEEEFRSPRFSIKKENLGCHLQIAHVEPSDEAMYYCGLRKFSIEFGKGTFLSVKRKADVSVTVFQSSVSDSVPAGASVTLQCSVLSESRAAELQVLWFRAAPSQSHPQIIYTHHNSSLQCESSTHTCVYNLSMNIFSLDDTGTYYCAVALCGKIIFGNGTVVQFERSVAPAVIFLGVALGVCVLVIFALLFVIICKWRNGKQHGVKLKQGSVTDQTLSQEGESVELNYAALHFNARKAKRGRVNKQQRQDVIYSDVRRLSVK
ncbi:uncharacterized protein LOC124385732 [Silurus meridionalis]|uniref:uncharacterized protein LOC124385732 n=1 Tax=Silurus meridionalis TaxID=175797 RepID=UPI001EE9E608|nr:uncharacterized protein LOC124385732 [Silurus meridionalis]